MSTNIFQLCVLNPPVSEGSSEDSFFYPPFWLFVGLQPGLILGDITALGANSAALMQSTNQWNEAAKATELQGGQWWPVGGNSYELIILPFNMTA